MATFLPLLGVSVVLWMAARGEEPYYRFAWADVLLNIGFPFFFVGVQVVWVLAVLVLTLRGLLDQRWTLAAILMAGCAGALVFNAHLYTEEMLRGVCRGEPPWVVPGGSAP